MHAKKTEYSREKASGVSASKNSSYSKLAITSFVTAIVNFLFPPFIAIISIIVGIFAITNIHKRKQKGEVLAWLGISLSLIQLLLLTIGILYVFHFPGVKVESPSQAVQEMTPQEKQYFDKTLRTLSSNSTVSLVNTLLGKPYKTDQYLLITSNYYYCPSTFTSDCVIKIQFVNNKVYTVTWVDPERFSYIKHYRVQ